MDSLRFMNPELQQRFVAGMRAQGLGALVRDDGSVAFDEEQRSAVTAVAHGVRDGCFEWYFSWCDSPEAAKELEAHLRASGLRFEIEDHGHHLVFLLPKADEARHGLGGPPPAAEHCSFCGKSYADVHRFYASDTAAICEECVEALYRELNE